MASNRTGRLVMGAVLASSAVVGLGLLLAPKGASSGGLVRIPRLPLGQPEGPSEPAPESEAPPPSQRTEDLPEEQESSAPADATGSNIDSSQTDDETALARMLASETSAPGSRVVIGWITINRARRAGWGLYRFITRGQGYGAGPQKRPGVHASTARPPTPETTALAKALLAGTVQPAAAIRAVRPGSWFERGQGPADQSLVTHQKRWQEGMWARLVSEGKLTKWVLYSSAKPIQQLQAGQTATELIDSLPQVEALDSTSYTAERPLVA